MVQINAHTNEDEEEPEDDWWIITILSSLKLIKSPSNEREEVTQLVSKALRNIFEELLSSHKDLYKFFI